jgi:hypothetical protein
MSILPIKALQPTRSRATANIALKNYYSILPLPNLGILTEPVFMTKDEIKRKYLTLKQLAEGGRPDVHGGFCSDRKN